MAMIIAAKNTQTPKYEKTKNDLRHQALQPESDINVQWYENPVICNVYIRMYIYIYIVYFTDYQVFFRLHVNKKF